MRSVRSWWLVLGALFGGALFGDALGCSTKADCGCLVEKGNERRSVACGQSACVAGTLEICSETGQIVERGSCNAAPPATGQPDTGGSTAVSGPPDQSCSDLLIFCTSSCNSPTTASTDCQNTASSGDSAACAQWQQTSGIVCRP